MSEYKIEKGIPLAPKTQLRRSRYPFSQMEVGDSFFVPVEADVELGLLHHRVHSCASYMGKRLGRKFTTRSNETGVRVWRTE